MPVKMCNRLAIAGFVAALALTISTLPTPATAQEKTLYDRLGGYEAISAVVDDFANRLFADTKINQFFVGMSDDTRMSFKQKNKNLLCNVTGGPCQVISRDAAVAHSGLGITAGDFDVVAGHLKAVLDEFKVPQGEQDEVFAIILSLRPKIVDRPEVTDLSKDAPVRR